MPINYGNVYGNGMQGGFNNPNMGNVQQAGGFPNVGGIRGYLSNYRQTPQPVMGGGMQGPKVGHNLQPQIPMTNPGGGLDRNGYFPALPPMGFGFQGPMDFRRQGMEGVSGYPSIGMLYGRNMIG